jgi:hypothetical protein
MILIYTEGNKYGYGFVRFMCPLVCMKYWTYCSAPQHRNIVITNMLIIYIICICMYVFGSQEHCIISQIRNDSYSMFHGAPPCRVCMPTPFIVYKVGWGICVVWRYSDYLYSFIKFRGPSGMERRSLSEERTHSRQAENSHYFLCICGLCS